MSWLSSFLDQAQSSWNDTVNRSDVGKFMRATNVNTAFLNPQGVASAMSPGSSTMQTKVKSDQGFNPYIIDSQGRQVFDPRAAKGFDQVREQIKNSGLDQQTIDELLAMQNGAGLTQAFADAQAGNGKYAARKNIMNFSKMFMDRPGSAQLFSGAASRSAVSLTGDVNGLLTNIQGQNK